MKNRKRPWILLTFWLLVHLPTLLIFFITGLNSWGQNLTVYALSISPALLWGWGLPAALRYCARDIPDAINNLLSLRLRSFLYPTLSTYLALITLFVYRAFNYESIMLIKGFETEGFLPAGVTWILCFSYWLIRDINRTKKGLPGFTFKFMQLSIVCTTIMTMAVSIVFLLEFGTRNTLPLLIGVFAVLFSYNGILYSIAVPCSRRIKNVIVTKKTKVRFRKTLIWTVSLAIVFIPIGQQLVSMQEHEFFVQEMLLKSDQRQKEALRIADNWDTFRPEIDKLRQMTVELEAAVPTFQPGLDDNGSFAQQAESIAKRHHVIFSNRQEKTRKRAFHIEVTYSWQVEGDSEQILNTLHEIDKSPRLVGWGKIPEGSDDSSEEVNGEVQLHVYKFISAKHANASGRNNRWELGTTPEYDTALPIVWLPPFSFRVEHAKLEYAAHFSALKPIPHQEQAAIFRNLQNEFRMRHDVFDTLDREDNSLKWLLSGKPPITQEKQETKPKRLMKVPRE